MLLVPEVSWSPVDGNSFDQALTDHGRTVTARVSVDASGAPTDFSTTDRFCYNPEQPKQLMRARWSTPVAGWTMVDGRQLPTAAQAVWHLPEGPFAYVDFRLVPGAFVLSVHFLAVCTKNHFQINELKIRQVAKACEAAEPCYKRFLTPLPPDFARIERIPLIGGAAGGHWGEGAGIGALVGTMGSGMRMRREQQQAAVQQGSMQQQASSQLSTYNRAVGACMTGRGYTVE